MRNFILWLLCFAFQFILISNDSNCTARHNFDKWDLILENLAPKWFLMNYISAVLWHVVVINIKFAILFVHKNIVFGLSKLFWMGTNCFGRVQITLFRFKLDFSGLIFIIWTCPKWFGSSKLFWSGPNFFGQFQIRLF